MQAGIKVQAALGQLEGGLHYKGTNPHCLALPISLGDPFWPRKGLGKG